jgi:hypothetical protein
MQGPQIHPAKDGDTSISFPFNNRTNQVFIWLDKPAKNYISWSLLQLTMAM